jgi:ABC-type polysaccharide transport system, permease component
MRLLISRIENYNGLKSNQDGSSLIINIWKEWFQIINNTRQNLKIEYSLFLKRLKKSKYLLVQFSPCLLCLILFTYRPMWGVLIAFKDYRDSLGFAVSKWVGLKWFSMFLNNPDALRVIKNTFLLGFYSVIWEFAPPIIFALMLNEVRRRNIRKIVQSISYLPYFLSLVVIVGIIQGLLSPRTGGLNELIVALGGTPINFLYTPGLFRTIFIASDIWQYMGWSSIIYTAALSAVNLDLYDSASIDGCNKLQRVWHIDIASISPTIITLLILSIGRIMNVGFAKVFLLYNPSVYSTADVISTYVYRQGIKMSNYSYASAVDLFQSLINIVFLIICNSLAKKYTEESIW